MSVRSAELASPTAARGPVHAPSTPVTCSCASEAKQLLAAVARDGLGAISPSVYETARVVATGPWLPGHRSRIEYLLSTQRPDGGWGGPEAYALVPTLSATEALLGIVLEPGRLPAPMVDRCVRAAGNGLAFARAQLRSLRVADLPDTPGIEVIVPFLVGRLNDGLARLRTSEVSGLDAWRGRGVRLPLPRGLTDKTLRAVTAVLAGERKAPLKVQHSLEVAGELAAGIRGVPRLSTGTVGASPAATVAWLGTPPVDRSGEYTRYLRRVITQLGGPVACVIPIINFERAWVVNNLAAAGLPLAAPRTLAERMAAALSPRGLAGGDGMPPDVDTTSSTVTALRHLGVPIRNTVLRRFDVGTHFCGWVGERTVSSTAHAHVLTALVTGPEGRSAWRTSAIDRVTSWLCDAQERDGYWTDKWHASPYYATACVVAGLRDAWAGEIPARPAAAIDRAVAWVLASQRRDGSWGRWSGTPEETAYALQILLYKAPLDRRMRAAARRGYAFLVAGQDREPVPLWHGKDLYDPPLIVRSALVGARHLAETTLGLLTPEDTASVVARIPRQRRMIMSG